MDCGVPFCNNGCPLGNLIPDWNDLVRTRRLARGDRPAARDQQLPRVHRPDLPGAVRVGLRARHRRRPGDDQADRVLRSTSAPSRRAGSSPSRPRDAQRADRRRRRLRPAGLAAADELNQVGHPVTVYERDEAPRRPAALRRPRREAREVDRSTAAPTCSPPRGRLPTAASTSAPTSRATSCASATTRSCSRSGSRVERDLEVSGRELDGVHFAMDYLYQRNRAVARDAGPRRRASRRSRSAPPASDVVVIGGGDTGMDCVSNAQPRGRRRRDAARRLPRGPRRAAATPTRRGRAAAPARPRPTPSTRAASARFGHQVIGARGRGRPGQRSSLAREVTGELLAHARAGPGQRVHACPADLVLIAIGFTAPRARRPVADARARPRPPRQRQRADRSRPRPTASSPAATPASASR